MKKSFIKFFTMVLVFATACTFTGCGEFLRGERKTKLANVVGTVNVLRESEEILVEKKLRLKSGDSVKTGAQSSCVVIVDSDKEIRASENTCFNVVTSGDKKEGAIKVRLDDGQVNILTNDVLTEKNSFEVETENATIVINGTLMADFMVAKEDGIISIDVNEGLVRVKSKSGKQLDVKSGENVMVDEHGFNYISAQLQEKLLPFTNEKLIRLDGKALYEYSLDEIKAFYGDRIGYFNEEDEPFYYQDVPNGFVFEVPSGEVDENEFLYSFMYFDLNDESKTRFLNTELFGIVELAEEFGVLTLDDMMNYLGVDTGNLLDEEVLNAQDITYTYGKGNYGNLTFHRNSGKYDSSIFDVIIFDRNAGFSVVFYYDLQGDLINIAVTVYESEQ